MFTRKHAWIGQTVLLLSLWVPQVTIADEASGDGARIPARNDGALGYLSLAYAAEHGDIVTVKAWLARGVDVNGKHIRTGDSQLVEQARGIQPPIALAAERGHLDVVEVLLRAGAKPDKCCCSCVTALHQAIRNKHAEIVKVLLGAGASPLLLCDGKKTPLQLASEAGDPQIKAMVEAKLEELKGQSNAPGMGRDAGR